MAVLVTAHRFALPVEFPSALAHLKAARGQPTMCLDARLVTLERALRQTNRNMAVFDLALGSAAILAPEATLRAIGHEAPSPDTRHLFRRCGPIWLTFAAAHALADRRGSPEDWWALAWLRATEIATDALWAESPAVSRRGAKVGLRMAGVANLAMAVGFAWLAAKSG